MDKDRVEGKVKDIAGRVERQVGEWTGDPKKQADGAAKQVEGKVQNTWGKIKDAAKSSSSDSDKDNDREPGDTEGTEVEERKITIKSERKAG
jgi:uncharacterized protein YjbJ (UPF0337 family)